MWWWLLIYLLNSHAERFKGQYGICQVKEVASVFTFSHNLTETQNGWGERISLCKSVLASTNCLFVINMFEKGFPSLCFSHDLPRDQGKINQPVVPWIFPLEDKSWMNSEFWMLFLIFISRIESVSKFSLVILSKRQDKHILSSKSSAYGSSKCINTTTIKIKKPNKPTSDTISFCFFNQNTYNGIIHQVQNKA